MITLTGHWKGWGDQATPMDSSCPTQRWKRTRWCQLHSGLRQGKGALSHPPTEVNCPAPVSPDLSHKHWRNSAKPGRCLEPPYLGTGKPLKEARKDHGSARTEEVTSRRICQVFFFVCFCFYFPLSYATVIRNIVIKQQVLF